MLNREFLLELEEYMQEHLEGLPPLYSQHSVHSNYDVQEMELSDYLERRRKPSFQQVLFSYMDRSGLRDSEVYNKAGIDRKHFSKIRSNENYLPKKNTLIALAFALELNRSETDELLSSAGYSLSSSDQTDLIIQFFLEKQNYSITDMNEALDNFNLKPLLR
ncbi:hypothetical protein [Oceanobacillus saliphilus]|uniref:hypothetical protein n=1 Tax=Oceanobacillus saliphilus TaxID=2925834 RepID=UPI00201E49C6|nr:hypothetical protein [Oceanobacillus saliphilus]